MFTIVGLLNNRYQMKKQPGRKELKRRVARLIELREEHRQKNKSLKPLTRVMAWRMVRVAIATQPYEPW